MGQERQRLKLCGASSSPTEAKRAAGTPEITAFSFNGVPDLETIDRPSSRPSATRCQVTTFLEIYTLVINYNYGEGKSKHINRTGFSVFSHAVTSIQHDG
jgi:hypothetical protein